MNITTLETKGRGKAVDLPLSVTGDVAQITYGTVVWDGEERVVDGVSMDISRKASDALFLVYLVRSAVDGAIDLMVDEFKPGIESAYDFADYELLAKVASIEVPALDKTDRAIRAFSWKIVGK